MYVVNIYNNILNFIQNTFVFKTKSLIHVFAKLKF